MDRTLNSEGAGHKAFEYMNSVLCGLKYHRPESPVFKIDITKEELIKLKADLVSDAKIAKMYGCRTENIKTLRDFWDIPAHYRSRGNAK